MKERKEVQLLKPPSKLKIVFAIQWALFGLLYLLWQNDFIIWQGPERPMFRIAEAIINEPAKIFFIKNGSLQEEHVLITHQCEEEKATALLKHWADVLWQQKLIHQKITVDFISIDKESRTLRCSMGRRLFSKNSAAITKLRLLYGLFKTIQEAKMNIKSCFILLHHQLYLDEQLDLSCPWPIDIIQTID